MKFLSNFVIIVFSFWFFLWCSSFRHQSPRYIKLAHQITAETGKKLEAEKKLCLIGTGGQMMNDIQMMAMSFNYYQEVDVDTARKFLMYAVNEYLAAINNNTEVRPYLHEYPFTAKNVEIVIFIYTPNRKNPSLDKIYTVQSINGRFEYYTGLNDYKPIYQESYDEALQKISIVQQGSK